jgi:hypothetical protein
MDRDVDPCPHDNSARAGIVTNQPGRYDKGRPHASVAVCGSPTCRARGLAWVRQVTGEPGVYVSDASRSSAARGPAT